MNTLSNHLGLSESPASVASQALFPPRAKQELSLDEFIQALPKTIEQNKSTDDAQDLIGTLMEQLVLDPEDYQQYAHFNSSKHYTRNLIATDHTSYTLILLCWNAGQSSPIHDHPCDGCWMRVVTGSVQECRYQQDVHKEHLTCVSDEVYREGQQAFIQDSMGYHKVGNPSATEPAITLHLYCPPFQSCQIWMDPHDSIASGMKATVCYHSEYGVVV